MPEGGDVPTGWGPKAGTTLAQNVKLRPWLSLFVQPIAEQAGPSRGIREPFKRVYPAKVTDSAPR